MNEQSYLAGSPRLEQIPFGGLKVLVVVVVENYYYCCH